MINYKIILTNFVALKMKIINLYLQVLLISTNFAFSQLQIDNFKPFKAGESLEYIVNYGIFNASYASLKLSEETINNSSVILASGYGKTIGLARLLRLKIIIVVILNRIKFSLSFLKKYL